MVMETNISFNFQRNPHPPLSTLHQQPTFHIMGAIVSAIGGAIQAVISAIASILMIIISTIVTIIVTIFDVIFDILCCRCFGGRKRRTGTHKFNFGRGGGGSRRRTGATY
ncbi:hypothetical protein BXZ70DRAFT_1004695 [Cristinia sonorae]|uniref:Uncharacterized protein n=1 Tax=Cristinia sonorae TaxID=1940300 RepID=A0A8K0UW25_9AGAR|nr:hypothetical protein BXZ70DRAFT_1004695 [Cristinia sonorae]